MVMLRSKLQTIFSNILVRLKVENNIVTINILNILTKKRIIPPKKKYFILLFILNFFGRANNKQKSK